ncbi:MAG: tetratricopeptide repeat protein [bacterium]
MPRILLFAMSVCAVVLVFSSVRFVGEDQVWLTGAGADEREMGPGLHLVKPFAEARRYDLTSTYVFAGDRRLVTVLPRARRASLDCVVEARLERSAVRLLDRQYKGEVAERLLRPLVVREVARLLAIDPAGAALEGASGDIVDGLNRATGEFGLEIEGISFGEVTVESGLPDDLKRSDGLKVFILGLDGFDWKVVDLVARTRDLANIDRLRREGCWGNLRSVEPMISPLVWTTIATGVTPDLHGISDFLARDATTGEDIPVTSSMRSAPALWNYASLMGLTSGFVGWLATYPAEEVEGFMVSDRVAYHMFDPAWFKGRTEGSAEGLTYPADLIAEIAPLLVRPEDVTGEVGVYISGQVGRLGDKFDPDDPVSNLRLSISGYRTYENVTRSIYPRVRPDLGGVYFEFTDSACHLFMRYMKPGMPGVTPQEEARYGEGVAAAYAEADRILGEVMALLDDRTVLVIVSDHGFKSGDMRPAGDSRIGHGQAIAWHRMDGVVAFWGQGVKRGQSLAGAGVLDIAPTVLHVLGLPVDQRMPGRVLEEAFDPAWVASHPVRRSGGYDMALPGSGAVPVASEADQALKDKLASLGYVAGGNTALVNMANFYQKNGRYAEAIDVWRKLLEADPNDLGARVGLSNAYFEVGKEDSARVEVSRVLEADPRNMEALRSLATFHVRKGAGREALEVADRALAVDPEDGHSHFNRGLSLELLGRAEEAAVEYREALRSAPDLAEAYANLAQIHLAAGFGDEALAAARKAVDLASGEPEMHYVLGQALDLGGNRGEALEEFFAAMRLDPRFAGAYIGAANVLLAEGKPDSAMALCDRGLAAATGYRQYLHNIKGLALVARRDLGGAAGEFRRALEADPGFLPARVRLAAVLLEQGQTAEARKQLQAVLAADPSNQEARSMLQRAGG